MFAFLSNSPKCCKSQIFPTFLRNIGQRAFLKCKFELHKRLIYVKRFVKSVSSFLSRLDWQSREFTNFVTSFESLSQGVLFQKNVEILHLWIALKRKWTRKNIRKLTAVREPWIGTVRLFRVQINTKQFYQVSKENRL